MTTSPIRHGAFGPESIGTFATTAPLRDNNRAGGVRVQAFTRDTWILFIRNLNNVTGKEANSPAWAGKFLDEWCRQTMRSRIEPMKKIARSLRNHRELILNYFRAQKLLSSGVVEGLNNKAKVTMRKSYGFRTFRVLEMALYHSLGKLPEPESTHEFF